MADPRIDEIDGIIAFSTLLVAECGRLYENLPYCCTDLRNVSQRS